MPRPAAAATLAALVLVGAAACKPSSLAPGWIGERGPGDYGEDAAANGLWQGATSGGGLMQFQVASGDVSDLALRDEGPCRRSFALVGRLPIEDGAFSTTVELDLGGFFTVSANFQSPDAARGSYSYSGVQFVEGCPREGSGTFAAAPVP